MEGRKSHESGKIASCSERGRKRSEEERLSQRWRKKIRDEYYDGTSSWKRDRKHNISWSSLSQRGRRIEDKSWRSDDLSSMEKGKIAPSSWRGRRRRDEYDGASSWKRKSNGKDKISWSLWSRRERRTEELHRRRSEDRRDDATSWKRKSNGEDKFSWSLWSSRRERKTEDLHRRRSEDRTDDATSWKIIERASKRKRRREGTDEILNHDVLEQVMLRLPVKSLLRFQTVSKHWRGTIRSKSFKERHMLHQKTQEPKVVCLYSYTRYRSWYRKVALKTMRLEWSSACLVEEEEEGYHISDDKGIPTSDEYGSPSDSIDGLVCLYASTREITVINPATRWSYKLPLANFQIDNNDSEVPLPGFGKDYVTGTHKIVWLHNINKYNTTLSCDIFDFEVKQWRQVPPPLPEHRLNNTNLPTFANGWLYWFHLDLTKLIAFDLHTDMFQVIPNPIIETLSSSVVDMSFGSIDDDRRLVWALETNGDGMQHVWRLTNHNTGGALLKMDKLFSIDLNKINPTCYTPHDETSLFHPAAISKNGNKVMLFKQFLEPLLFQPPNSTYHILSCSPLRDSLLVPFFPSLVSPFMS